MKMRLKILSYLFEIQSIDFELSATAVWGYVFDIGKRSEGKKIFLITKKILVT
jgi:hypothetical protein